VAKTDTRRLVRPHLADVQTYKSIDPPEVLARRAGIPESKIVKLNGNENPYGPSPKAVEAVAGAPLHIYPDPQQRKMRQSLSEYTGLGAEHLIAGAGSDELIDLLFRLFIEPGDRILDFDPTFAMYAFCARVCGGDLTMLQRNELFEIDMETVRASIDDRAKIVFVSSPNNPTGNLLPDSQVKELLDTGLIVVVDEAYFEFCGHTVAELVPEYSNLVVLRTMSKWAGLAGLRVGYGIMSPDIVSHLMDIKSPYNVNVAGEAALLASLDDAPALLENVGKIVAERTRLQGILEEMPGITPWPSEGNFILCQMPDAAGAQRVYDELAGRGVFVRNFGSDRLQDCFRVAVGTPAETDAFVEALREVVR